MLVRTSLPVTCIPFGREPFRFTTQLPIYPPSTLLLTSVPFPSAQLVFSPFQLQYYCSGWRENDSLTIGDVPYTAHKAVVLTVHRYPVDSQTGQRQHFVCLWGSYYTGFLQILQFARRIANINAAYLRTGPHQDHTFTLVERQLQISGQGPQRFWCGGHRLISRSVRNCHSGFPVTRINEKVVAVHGSISRFYYRQAFQYSKDHSCFFIANGAFFVVELRNAPPAMAEPTLPGR